MAQDDPIGQFIALPQDQQMAMLQQLSKDKQDKLLDQVKERKTSFNTKLTRPNSLDFRKNHHPILSAASDFGGGAINAGEQMIAHPIDTAKGTVQTLTDVGNAVWPDAAAPEDVAASKKRIKSQLDFFRAHPAYALGGLVGGADVGEVAGETVANIPKVVPKVLRRGTELITQTTPRETAKLVKETQEGNAGEVARVSGENRKAAQGHLEKTQEALHETAGRELQHQSASKEAESANAKASQEHEQAVQVVDAANNAKLAEHATKTRSIEQENAERQAAYDADKSKAEEIGKAAKEQESKRGQLARQINQQSSRLVDRLKSVQAKWKDSSALQKTKGYKPTGLLDVMYDNLRKATAGQTVPIETVGDAVRKAQAKLKGSAESIKQFNDILAKEKAENADDFVYQGGAKFGPGTNVYESVKTSPEGLPGGDPAKPLNFSDLQGYYTELGSKLAPGNLLPDVYLALRSLQDDVGGMMKGMATKAGVPSLYTRAQSAYRDYMQTFRDSTGPNHSGSPIAQALEAKDPAYAIKPLTAEESAQRVRNALTRFDPGQNGQGGAAALYDNFRAANREFDALGKPIKVPESPVKPEFKEPPSAPALSPRPEVPKLVSVEPPQRVSPPNRPLEAQPEIKKLGPEDVREAKQKGLEHRAEFIKKRGGQIAATFGVYRILESVIHGNLSALPNDFAGAIVGYGMTQAIGKIMEIPKVEEFLTRPTARDLAQIPPEMRSSLPNIIKAAQSRGIRVSPALIAIAAGSGAITHPRHPVLSAASPVQ